MFAARAVFAAGQRRAFSVSARSLSKVTVLGAAGGIGQPLSLLLKLNPRVSELALYDIRGGPGVAAAAARSLLTQVNYCYLAKPYRPGVRRPVAQFPLPIGRRVSQTKPERVLVQLLPFWFASCLLRYLIVTTSAGRIVFVLVASGLECSLQVCTALYLTTTATPSCCTGRPYLRSHMRPTLLPYSA
ncbi:hypothetical protein NUW58_g8974 [Xylaria curta]|uniref:Uncharacterized protein n=1 Tax=Xylaria curta TaxID=42375 RepID=A0ACC1N3C3_9PEZI|nr:hypothetical protein NUW58_g8974 [Xylaria curta]